MLFDPANAGERQLHLAIHARAGVAEPQRLQLDPVHEDDANASVGIVVEFTDRLLDELTPREALLIQWAAFLGE